MIRQQFWLLNFFEIFSPLGKVVNCAFPLLMVRAMSVIAFGETCATSLDIPPKPGTRARAASFRCSAGGSANAASRTGGGRSQRSRARASR